MNEPPIKTGHADHPISPEEASRRQFLERLSIGLSAAAGAAILVPSAGFSLAPLFRQGPSVWRPVGKASEFKLGETVAVVFQDASPLPWAGVTANTAAWLRREKENEFIAFSINCSHLGCPVRWLKEAGLFMCPCHGGVYYKDGTVAAGPPPRPLTRYEVRIREGAVELLTQPIRVS